jgi:hypothetical protein
MGRMTLGAAAVTSSGVAAMTGSTFAPYTW